MNTETKARSPVNQFCYAQQLKVGVSHLANIPPSFVWEESLILLPRSMLVNPAGNIPQKNKTSVELCPTGMLKGNQMVSTWVQLKRFQDNKLCKFREICWFSHQILHFWILLKLLQELQEFWSEKQLTLLNTFQMLVYPCTATKGNKLSSADNTALILPNSPDDTHITLIALIIENE